MNETSKLQKYLMWYKVKELFSNDLNKSRIGISLGLHRQTVSNFVNRVRLNHNLPKGSEKSYRPYEKQPETPYGQYAQCDFGEHWMKTSQGIPLKVYFLQ